MNQAHLNRSVARATGESVRCIRNMGFTLIVPPAFIRLKRSDLPRPARSSRDRSNGESQLCGSR